MEKINQTAPSIGEEEKNAMAAYLGAGGWLTEFKKTREFERMIAEYTGSRHAVAVNNGTVSLVIALMAIGVKDIDEVIVPDYTMIASANAVVLAGAKPVLVDIDAATLCLDPGLVEKAITPRTRAIMHVSINGRSTNVESVAALARKHKLFLIEDAAQSLGSRRKGKHLGTFGEIGSFSFSPHKIITTGQGGALITDDDDLFKKISMIKDFGRPQAGIDYHEVMGLNSKFTDLQAVIGIEQMKKLGWRVKRKKDIYRLYQKLLRDVKQVEFINTDLDDCSPWFMDILLSDGKTKTALAKFLDQQEIGTRPFYPAIHTQPPYSWVSGRFSNSLRVSERGLWLPSSVALTDAEIESTCAGIREYFRSNPDSRA